MKENTMVDTITDAKAAEILGTLEHPRITAEYMQSRIRNEEYINPDSAPTLTICLITLDNGFHTVGISAPASNQNYNFDLGRKYARENAIKDLWGKFGFALSEKIHASKVGSALPGIDVPATPLSGNDAEAGEPQAQTPASTPSSPAPAATPVAEATPAETAPVVPPTAGAQSAAPGTPYEQAAAVAGANPTADGNAAPNVAAPEALKAAQANSTPTPAPEPALKDAAEKKHGHTAKPAHTSKK